MIKRIGKLFLISEKEYPDVTYFYILYFLIGAGMALGRGTADALFFKRYGIEYLPVMYIIVSITLCISSILYASLADRIPAEKFFKYLFTTLIILLTANWLLISNFNTELSYPIYFVIYEVASELLIIHAAHYFSQNFDILQTKRLSPVIMSGSQVGVIFGGLFLASTSHILGVQNIILIWCFILLMSLIIIKSRHKKLGTSPYFRPGYKSNNRVKQSIAEVSEGLSLIKDSKLLKSMSFALFFMVITFYVLCYSVNRIYTDTFKTEESLTAFFGILSAITSVTALLIQLFITNRVVRKFGAKKINLVFPITSIFSYLALLVSFSLSSAIISSFNKDSLMTALRNPVRNIFFSALPDNLQGRARATSIVVVMPIALSITGVLILLMQSMEQSAYLIALGISAAIFYLYYSRQTNKAYVSEMVLHLKNKLFIPETDKTINTDSNDNELLEELSSKLNEKNALTIDLARYISAYYPMNASSIIIQHINDTDHATKDQIIKLLSCNYSNDLHKYLLSQLDTSDSHLKHTILKTLFDSRRSDVERLIPSYLESDNPRIKAAGIYGALIYQKKDCSDETITIWLQLIRSKMINENIASLELISNIESCTNSKQVLINAYKSTIITLLNNESDRVLKLTIENLKYWPLPKFEKITTLVYEIYKRTQPSIRLECVKLCHLFSESAQLSLITDALEDNSSIVRDQAVEQIIINRAYTPSELVKWITIENKGSPRSQLSIMKALQKHKISKQEMKEIALAKAIDASLITQAIKMIESDDQYHSIPSLELLNYTLMEKRQETIDLALFAMHTLENPQDIDIIRAGIKTENPRVLSNACEVLLNMNERDIADILIEIFENLSKKPSNKNSIQEFTNTAELLDWCSKRSDPWLQTCSHNAIELYSNELATKL